MDDNVKEFIRTKNINIEENIIWRSVSKRDVIIPYDEKGDALRLAVEGDRPSAFRAIYFVLFALTGINLMTIAGYLQLTRSILVSRNEPAIPLEPPLIPTKLVEVEVEVDLNKQDSAMPPGPANEDLIKQAEKKVERKRALDELVLRPCPIPFGKVIYVNSEEKNIDAKVIDIKDPKINTPKTVENLEKRLKEKVKIKSTKSKTASAPLGEKEIEAEKIKIKKDLEDLANQLNFGSAIPKFSELKDMQCERLTLSEDPDEPIGLALLLSREGGKTRKHKRFLKKKKSTTRNKNKIKKAKKTKKTIKRRKVIKKKHQKTR
jgi:hypothetical protein